MAELLVRDRKKLQQGNEARAVLSIYYDGERKVLVLDDALGNELETNGFARLPNNPVLKPYGSPLTARATTNLAIAETLDGRVFGIYRGYGEHLDCTSIKDPNKKIKEGKSAPFLVVFDLDDVTPIRPLPLEPLFTSLNRWLEAGIEDLRIARYNGGYFCPFVAARKPTSKGIKYGGAGAILSLDLKLQKIFSLRGLPYFIKDFVPAGNKNSHYAMYFSPRIPNHVKNLTPYRKFHSEHPGIWIAISQNLRDWEVQGEVLKPLDDERQIAAGTPLVDEVVNLGGNLKYIHGMKGEQATWREYYSRATLFSPKDPTKPIAMTPNFLFPREPYEKNDQYKIDHIFPMGVVQRRVKILSKVYDAHLISAGTGDISSSLYFVLVDYLKSQLKPIDKFNFSQN